MAEPAGKDKKGSRALGELVDRALDPLAARQGFSEAALLLRWEAIVGARLAAICEPVKLQWPPRAKNRPAEKKEEPATLVLRVEPGFGLDIQHMSATLLDRVNTHLGWRCVARLSLRQEPLAGRRRAPRRARPIDAAARERAAAATEGVTDEALRAALMALGELALGRAR
jgi:hypothetical protein